MIGKTMRDVNVPPLIVGDSAFPLRSWLLKPYTNAVLTPQQHYFNYRLSRARMVTEAAYGQKLHMVNLRGGGGSYSAKMKAAEIKPA